MIKETIYHGTTWSKLSVPEFTDQSHQKITVHHNAKKKGDQLDWKIDLVYTVTTPDKKKTFDVLKSQSGYTLTIENGVKPAELFELVKQAVNHLKKCPECEPEEPIKRISQLQYPPFEGEQEKALHDIAKLF